MVGLSTEAEFDCITNINILKGTKDLCQKTVISVGHFPSIMVRGRRLPSVDINLADSAYTGSCKCAWSECSSQCNDKT